nr:helicase HerA-like domain-containing protein [Flavobacterium sp. ACAM 123]
MNKKSLPPLVSTMMRAPMSRMDVLTESEVQEINHKSKLVKKYSELIDRESAYEMLNKKIAVTNEEAAKQEMQKEEAKVPKQQQGQTTADAVSKSVLKVLTSATFIRGALVILNKIIKK